eukprot:jgi/Ulvmu1/11678/UM008_0087.1
MQAVRAFRAHGASVSAVAWRPRSDLQVASVSHDGLLRLWDMRSPVSLATFDDCSGGKLFAAQWGWREGGQLAVATGGEDSQLRVYDAPAFGDVSPDPDAA